MKRALGLVFLAGVSFAQVDYFRFDIDQDALGGAPDHSWMNQPLGPGDRLYIRNGRFWRVGPDLVPGTEDDERIRLYGVNLAFGANFPEPADAWRIAARLRKLGVNLVRFHHMDSQPDSNPSNAGSILTTGPYPTLNPVAVARLRGFLDALKANGIYANINLKVGYLFRPSVDGIPPLPGGMAMPTQSKPLHIIHPRAIELQKEFTRKVLDALALKDDPVLAMVEINNESSLIWSWQARDLERVLLGEYKSVMEREWNRFLAAKYSSTEALKAAWGGEDTDGPELLPGKWTLEIHSPAQATLTAGPTEAVVRVSRGGAWVYLKQVGFSVSTGRTYLGEVEMRADLPDGQSRNVIWDIKEDVSPWRQVGAKTVAVTNQWQKFTISVTPSIAMNGIGRFALSVENVDAPVYVRNARFYQARRRGLDPGESLAEANISLPGVDEAGTQARTDDYLLFLAARDKHYLDEVMSAAREIVGAEVPVTGTQMGFGGLLNLDSHASMDYLDNHFYVDHYNFPNVAWDGRDWRFRDQSAIGSGLSSFQNMAVSRDNAKPFTVSEFNQPWPNRYAAEIDPALAAFGAFQDWDSIVHFAYSHGRGWDDGVPNGFNLNGDWTKWPAFAQAAYLFRSDAIHPGTEIIEIPVSLEQRLRFTRERRMGSISTFLNAATGYDPNLAFVHPVGITTDTSKTAPDFARKKLSGPFHSHTGDLTYDPAARLFLIHSHKAAGMLGFVGRQRVSAGILEVELAESARGFAAILLTPLDQKPLAESNHFLLSNPGYTLRTQPGSNPQRPQEIVRYPGASDWFTLEQEPGQNKPSGNLNGGQRPVWMEKVEAKVTIRSPRSRVTVYPLGPDGSRREPLTEPDITVSDGEFRIHLASPRHQPTPWYEIVTEIHP